MNLLKLESGVLVNLDFIRSINIISPNSNPQVALFNTQNEYEYFIACEGSRSKCEDFMNKLLRATGGIEIHAEGSHPCQCECGCKAKIREEFTICEDCEDGFHWGNSGLWDPELKKDAVESRGSIHTASHG